MGSSRTLRGGTSPAGELQSSSHNANLIAPYASEKIAYELQITCTVRTTYGNPKYKRYHVLICLDLPYRCVQVQTVQVVRTSSVKKMHFLRTGVDKRLNAYKTTHPAATGRSDIMYCTRVPKVGTLFFFCFLPEYTENFARRAKKRQNCNGKRKTPSPIADMQRQGPEKSD